MEERWLASSYVTKVLWVSVVLIFLAAESMLIVASLRAAWGRHPVSTGYLLLILLINAVPCVVGVKGYRVVRRMQLEIGNLDQDHRLIWLSRQFLAETAAAYGVAIANVIFLTEQVRVR